MQEDQEGTSAEDIAEIAKRIAPALSGEDGVHAEGIAGLLDKCGVQGEVNCYPGTDTDKCHRIAFFISLQSEKRAKGSGHLSFQKMLATLVRHMEGACEDQTLFAVIITDSWDVRAWEEWGADIEKIKAKKFLEAYLVVAGEAFPMPV